jgi:hypothetical protein
MPKIAHLNRLSSARKLEIIATKVSHISGLRVIGHVNLAFWDFQRQYMEILKSRLNGRTDCQSTRRAAVRFRFVLVLIIFYIHAALAVKFQT